MGVRTTLRHWTGECELVQWVGGMVLDRDELVISMGVGDCETMLATIPLADALDMLHALEP